MWLEVWNKTPLDLGVTSWNQVDPCWRQAMSLVKAGIEQQIALKTGTTR